MTCAIHPPCNSSQQTTLRDGWEGEDDAVDVDDVDDAVDNDVDAVGDDANQ